MTPERIAEFRDAIANHPHFGIGGDALSKILDALESAQAEIAVDAGRLRDAAMRVWGEDAHGCDTPDRLADAILGLRAQIADLKRGGVVVPEEEESARMKVVALSCGRHDANGDLLCGSCKHSWREANLEDCDEGCSKGRDDLFFHGEPWVDCPDFASRHPAPADRVLREGEARIGMNELQMLRCFAGRRMSEREYDHLEAVRDAHEDALRAQATTEKGEG